MTEMGYDKQHGANVGEGGGGHDDDENKVNVESDQARGDSPHDARMNLHDGSGKSQADLEMEERIKCVPRFFALLFLRRRADDGESEQAHSREQDRLKGGRPVYERRSA